MSENLERTSERDNIAREVYEGANLMPKQLGRFGQFLTSCVIDCHCLSSAFLSNIMLPKNLIIRAQTYAILIFFFQGR